MAKGEKKNNELTEIKRSKGQPRSFINENEFEDTFNKYIEQCMAKEYLPNIAGFCVFANMNRDTYYQQKEYYSDTFKKTQEILEDYTINAKINDTFKIFYMKNKFGYKDRTELDSNVNANINISEADKKLLDNLTERLK